MSEGVAALDWLGRRAWLSPAAPALVWEGSVWSFAGLDREVGALTEDMGPLIAPGSRVALLAGNSPEFVRAMHAVTRLGATVVPLNVRLTAGELAWQISDSGTTVLAFEERFSRTAQELGSKCPGLRLFPLGHWRGRVGDDRALPRPQAARPIETSSIHSIVYTSGTSGRPKGAMLTFGNHLWSALGSALNLGLAPNDRWLACLPLFHVGGMAILLRSVIYGMAVVLHPFFDAAAVSEAIDSCGVTIVSLVPTALARLLDERGDRPWPPHLRCLLVGGGPTPEDLIDECLRRGWPIAITYGLTEAASQVCTLRPEEVSSKRGSSGKPLFFTDVRIDGPPDGPGEILVRGPTVSPGYLNQPAPIDGGWLHTGDIGYLDPEGYLYVLDRRDDLIVSGGENVYPAEVEETLRSHEAVADAAVVGLPDREWGQRVVASVVLRRGASLAAGELQLFCRQRLAGYKVPKDVRFVESLPRTASGKLLRRQVREAWLTGEVS